MLLKVGKECIEGVRIRFKVISDLNLIQMQKDEQKPCEVFVLFQEIVFAKIIQ